MFVEQKFTKLKHTESISGKLWKNKVDPGVLGLYWEHCVQLRLYWAFTGNTGSNVMHIWSIPSNTTKFNPQSTGVRPGTLWMGRHFASMYTTPNTVMGQK